MAGSQPGELRAEAIRWELAPPGLLRCGDFDVEALLVEALADADAYRTLAQVALAQLAETRGELARLRERYDQLRDECRRTREAVFRVEAAS